MILNTKTSGELLKYVGKLEEEIRKIREVNRENCSLLDEFSEKIRELKEENKRVKGRADDNKSELRKEIKHLNEMIYKLEEKNRKLKESLDIATKCSSKEEDGIIRLSEENKKLKEYNGELIENHKKDIAILCEENNKLKLHIEAKDKAYTALLKDYEELKEDRDKMEAEIEQRLNAFRNR